MLEVLKAKLFVFGSVQTVMGTEPYYADMAACYSVPSIFRPIVDWFSDCLKDKEFDHICGVETASLPLVGAIGYRDALSVLYLRKKRKPYGTQQLVEGKFKKGDSIYLIDDVSVAAPPTMEFVKTLESEGLHVKGVIVIFKVIGDERCKDIFESNGYEYQCMFDYEEFAEALSKHADELNLDKKYASVLVEYALSKPSS